LASSTQLVTRYSHGNGIVHTLTQNARQLPATSTDSGGVLSHQYSYDYSGNVTQIIDPVRGPNYSRWMTYDGLNRLKTAQSCRAVGWVSFINPAPTAA